MYNIYMIRVWNSKVLKGVVADFCCGNKRKKNTIFSIFTKLSIYTNETPERHICIWNLYRWNFEVWYGNNHYNVLVMSRFALLLLPGWSYQELSTRWQQGAPTTPWCCFIIGLVPLVLCLSISSKISKWLFRWIEDWYFTGHNLRNIKWWSVNKVIHIGKLQRSL